MAMLKSFSKAGRLVGLTQPSVSGSIQALEKGLGVKLLDRNGREASLTRPGEVLFSYAKQILMLRKDAIRQIQSLADLKKGFLVIGASSIPGEYILPHMIQSFYQSCPGIFCMLKVSDSQKVLQSLLDHDIEIGFVGTRINQNQPDILYDPLIEDKMVVCCSSKHPWAERKMIHIDELASQPFLQREEGSGTRREIEKQLSQAGFDLKKLQIVAEMGSTEAIKQGIKSGYGISILSAISIEDLEKAGRVKSLSVQDVPLVRHFFIAELKNREHSPAHNKFRQEIFKNKELKDASG